jgi:asparagine synthase (glutamine-hydrolysing)
LAEKRARWDKPQDFVLGAHALPTVLSDEARWARVNDPLQAMMQVDIEGYLTDDILVKVDRASMAAALMLVEPADVPGLAHALASRPAEPRGRRSQVLSLGGAAVS